MTTGAFRGEIYMTPLHNPGPKIGTKCKQRAIIFCGAELSQFCPKICCHSNVGRQGRNLNDTIE